MFLRINWVIVLKLATYKSSSQKIIYFQYYDNCYEKNTTKNENLCQTEFEFLCTVIKIIIG